MKKISRQIILIAVLLLIISVPMHAAANNVVLKKEEFNRWVDLPEYTVLNTFPLKGNNCTWYAHGRMLQLGYCKFALDTMRYHAYSWADHAARGAEVTDIPRVSSIAYWDRYVFFGSSLGHVGVVEALYDDGSILVSDSSISAKPYNVRLIHPNDSIWPTAFIVVPEGPERSRAFKPGDLVETTAGRLNFRLEGVDQDPVLLDKGEIAEVKEHVSNGLYASQPGSIFSYHNWWYAAVELEGELRHGWLAETYLEEAGIAEGEPEPEQEKAPDPGSNQDSDPESEPEPEKAPEPESNSEPEPEPEPGLEPEPEPELEPEPEPEPEDELDPGSEEDKVTDAVPLNKPGDISGDGEVNARDVVMVMHYVLRSEPLNDEQIKAADVNGDDAVDIRDVVLIMQYILRLIDSFEIEAAV